MNIEIAREMYKDFFLENYDHKNDQDQDLNVVKYYKTDYDEYAFFESYGSNVAYFVISGTDDKEEWKSNFNKELNDSGFHTGFYRDALKILKQIMMNFNMAIIANYNLVFIGHSRGGAIAMLLAWLMQGKSKQVFTFGAPRVMSKKGLKNYYGVTIGNIIHEVQRGDYVTQIPRLFYTENPGKTITKGSRWEWLKFWKIKKNHFKYFE